MDDKIIEAYKPLVPVVIARYDPDVDIRPVDTVGFINLRDAYVNHNVPTVVATDPEQYNGIDDPESIAGTPKDIFEAYRMYAALTERAESVSPSQGEAK